MGPLRLRGCHPPRPPPGQSGTCEHAAHRAPGVGQQPRTQGAQGRKRRRGETGPEHYQCCHSIASATKATLGPDPGPTLYYVWWPWSTGRVRRRLVPRQGSHPATIGTQAPQIRRARRRLPNPQSRETANAPNIRPEESYTTTGDSKCESRASSHPGRKIIIFRLTRPDIAAQT